MNNVVNMKQWLEDDEKITFLGDIRGISFAVCSQKKLTEELTGDKEIKEIHLKDGFKYQVRNATKNLLISAVNHQIIECKRELEDGGRKGFHDDEEEMWIFRLADLHDSLRKIKEQPASRNFYVLSHQSLKSFKGEVNASM